MKLSCIPVTWFKDIIEKRLSLSDWIQRAANLGLDGIDLAQAWLSGMDLAAKREIGRHMSDAGIDPCMIRCAPDFTHPSSAHREAEVKAMLKMIEDAALFGAPLVRITAGQAHPETGREQGIRWAVDGFQTIAPVAREHRVTLVFENHTKASVWVYRDFSEDEDVYLRILEAVGREDVFVNFDTANPVVHGCEPLDLLRRVGDRVRCVDANDAPISGQFQFCTVGRGVVPYREIFSYLKRHLHYDGWISLEEASFTGEAGFREGIRFVRETWDAC